MLRRTLGPSVQINTEFDHDLPAICVDPNQLELALLNLALNARDAMPIGGHLTIAAHCQSAQAGPGQLQHGSYVCISVRDSGTGMDELTVRRATEPFFTTKGTGKGTGLGLSMVDGLAAQSGGAMRILSHLGEGTTVELWLPTSELTPIYEQQVDVASLGTAVQWRVLVVDDDTLIAAATAEILDDLGHVVIESHSGQQALDLLEEGTQVDLVVTDHAMPGMTGTQLAQHIKARWPDLPVILATGYAELPDAEDPGLPRLSKPYQQEQLAVQIARVFETSARSVSQVAAVEVVQRV
jgi:CheY-like chemotaxis protein